MSEYAVLNGEAVVCKHSKKWIDSCRIELGLSEAEVVERIINGYVHSWHIQFEIPVDATYSTVGAAIRKQLNRGSHES